MSEPEGEPVVDPVVEATRVFRCRCDAAGSDIGELMDHILDHEDMEAHWPLRDEHTNDRMWDHRAEMES